MTVNHASELEALAEAFLGQPEPGRLGALRRWLETFDTSVFDLIGLFAMFSRTPPNRPVRRPDSASPPLPGQPDAARASWHTLEMFDTPHAAVKLFLVPAQSNIPIHDHPGMTVLMRELIGRARITAWDWMDENLASVCFDREVKAGDPIYVTTPDAGNLHAIRAVTDFAFVDLLVPPYAPAQGRACRIYSGSPTGQSGQWQFRLSDIYA